MRDTDIPVRIVAMAANEAAKLVGEDPADAFLERPSRARLIAIEAIRLVFPFVPQITIGRCFGFEGSAKDLDRRLDGVRYSTWWREEHVKAVFTRLAPHSAVRLTVEHGFEPTVQQDERAYSFTPRKAKPSRIITPIARVRNVTGALLGDPGFRSYRQDSDQRSHGR